MFAKPAQAAEVATARINSVGVPSGFAELTREHEILSDVYFGGQKVGEARILVRPGHVRFKHPTEVLGFVPNLKLSEELASAVAGDLPSNAAFACPERSTNSCGSLSPETFGVILDEDHFRLDVFVNPKFLALVSVAKERYLSTPTSPLSLTSSSGLALSGSNETSTIYNVQNRTIVAYRNARVRADSSFASKYGLVVDTLAGELDRPGIRYSAGLFWAPGLELTGHRRIAGFGVSTQLDTRTDRESLIGTPLVLFLPQPSRVDFLVDGRLIQSHAYEAGNNVLDTSTLPDGSYLLVLRIHDANGIVREERRFFAKNTQVAPVGQAIYFGYAGLLANTQPGQAISVSNRIYYQFGAARRLSNALALDLSVVGTGSNPLVQAGAWVLTPLARVRLAGLISPSGDHGLLLQGIGANTGRLSVAFDLRRVRTHAGRPLIPFSNYIDTFNSVPLNGRQFGNGSYIQASGSIGYHLGAANVALVGSLRKDEGLRRDYSIGPNISWPIINSSGLQVSLQADAQLTRTTTAAYVGVRMFFTSRGFSVASVAGGRAVASRDGSAPSQQRAVGDTTAHYSYSDDKRTELSLAAGLTRELDSTAGHADAFVYSRFGSARGEIVHDFEGDKRTQYSLSVQTGGVLNRNEALLGGRDVGESGLVISIDGEGGSEFEVLINGQPHGRVQAGERLPIFLEPYRAYSVRLRPVNAPSVWYETAAREFNLYPGNVEHVEWHIEHLLTVFGRAVKTNGEPVANASISGHRGNGQSNYEGFFQIETVANEVLSFSTGAGEHCEVTVGQLDSGRDYQALGKVVCK